MVHSQDNRRQPLAVILAGGRARRMQGCAKPLRELHGRPLIDHVLATIQSEVAEVVISVNANEAAYRQFNKPCIADAPVGRHSPLVGIYSAMSWYRERGTSAGQLLVVPADVPYFPAATVRLLQAAAAASPAQCACVLSRQRLQPLFSMWSLELVDSLATLIDEDNLGVKYALQRLGAPRVQVEPESAHDFFNVNSDADLAELAANCR